MILEANVAAFIEKHKNSSVAELALLLSKKRNLPKEFIINQINGRRKASSKLPFLLKYPDFSYPSPTSFSQASSEQTGRYKANLVQAKSILDLSGGMGMDSYFFSLHANQVDYVELNPNLVEIAQSNFKTLEKSNITCHFAKAEEYIIETEKEFDLIYLDPDRRAAKEKAFKIDECEPNVAELLPSIWKKTKHCLVKLSPMLDIKQALTQLPFCKEVHIVSVDNDCKELLFLLEKDFADGPKIICTNIFKNSTEIFKFTFEEERTACSEFINVEKYIYEPNASIMKAGAFKSVGAKFKLNKLATNTHIYTSAILKPDFPGRKLNVIQVEKPRKGLTDKANVVCRNFSMKPEQLKKKFKIKDGGNQFLYAVSLENGSKQFILAELI